MRPAMTADGLLLGQQPVTLDLLRRGHSEVADRPVAHRPPPARRNHSSWKDYTAGQALRGSLPAGRASFRTHDNNEPGDASGRTRRELVGVPSGSRDRFPLVEEGNLGTGSREPRGTFLGTPSRQLL